MHDIRTWINPSFIDNLQTIPISNSIPDDKILALSRLKLFADDNFIVAQMVQFLRERVDNIVGKGQNAGFQMLQSIVYN